MAIALLAGISGVGKSEVAETVAKADLTVRHVRVDTVMCAVHEELQLRQRFSNPYSYAGWEEYLQEEGTSPKTLLAIRRQIPSPTGNSLLIEGNQFKLKGVEEAILLAIENPSAPKYFLHQAAEIVIAQLLERDKRLNHTPEEIRRWVPEHRAELSARGYVQFSDPVALAATLVRFFSRPA